MFAVIVAALFLLNLSETASSHVKTAVREAVAPFESFFDGFSGRMRAAFAALAASSDVRKTERELTEQVMALRQKVNDLASLEQENAMLREQLGFAGRAGHKLILCEVINRGDAGGWWEVVRINKGSADGVGGDMAVITPDGLVGKTVLAAKHSCDVVLITDRSCNVSARTARSGDFGIVKGLGGESAGMGSGIGTGFLCVMEQLPAQADIREGDMVATCGLGGVFPKGLVVGTVAAAAADKSGLHKTAVLKPSADLAQLEYVFVVAGSAAGEERRGEDAP